MTSSVVRHTVIACIVIAAAIVAVAASLGHAGAGLMLAAGLLLGSANGYLLLGLMNRGAPFVAASLLRILFFSSLVLVAALTFRDHAWALALGIAAAQLVLVASGIRAGLRA